MRERETVLVRLTLNLSTSSILAVLPAATQVWKKDGATLEMFGVRQDLLSLGQQSTYLTPRASAVMLVSFTTELVWMTRKVPKSSTRRCWL